MKGDKSGSRSGGAHRTQQKQRRFAPLTTFVSVVFVLGVVGVWSLALGTREAPTDIAISGPKDGVAAPSATGTTASKRAETESASRGDKRLAPAAAAGPLHPVPTTSRPTPTATTTRPTPRTTTSAPAGGSSSSSSTGSGGTTTEGGTTTAPNSAPEAEVTRLVNVERAKAGCGAVRVEPKLAAAAEKHSADMVDQNYFSHTSLNGDGPGERAAAEGYTTWSGENIAQGYPTAAAVVEGWMNSPGHKANILNCNSKSTGVGFDPRNNMWTQMFGSV